MPYPTIMATWDTVISIKELLDTYASATGNAYILVVAQGTEETPRVIANSMGCLPETAGASVLMAMEESLSDLFEEMEGYLGFPGEDDLLP